MINDTIPHGPASLEPCEPPRDLIGLAEAARLVPCSRPGRKVHVSSLVRWVASGKLRGFKIMGRIFVSRADVLGMARPIPVKAGAEQ